MLDRSKTGTVFAPFTVVVGLRQLMFFAKAIGETNPVYVDETAARAAGHRSIPAPPTFAMVLDMDRQEDLSPEVALLQLDVRRILHGSQSFEYFAPIYAGDEITVTRQIVDIYDKKGGALEFVVTESRYTNQDRQCVSTAQCCLVYRN
ncbi:MaoC family dehydratase N-terminal domain-containing protein [Pseudomonas sp. TH10]|uniref:MaoC family dehydratase N-terminal domain-containing protein n=1 Tax=Pseudomonas sp. TH10 TaxID=2796376 RepID=UPI00191345D5|nr:MaoC family dehydratase N-terminal domain-containing protein [Pseudomonas sp. TH10]MBK5517244.1 MaoC family dehydratase N-terminal domain-containing protein [Pseudomonas sp. TH10]